MTSPSASTDGSAVSLDSDTESWRASLAPQLAAGEKIVAWLETDLDTALRFNTTVLALTDRGLYAQNDDGSPAGKQAGQWLSWPFGAHAIPRQQRRANHRFGVGVRFFKLVRVQTQLGGEPDGGFFFLLQR